MRRDNPPGHASLQADPAVAALLRRACHDCHSGETRWPWYSYVAPASFLVAYDVHEAWEHLDFSERGELRRWAEAAEGVPPDDRRDGESEHRH